MLIFEKCKLLNDITILKLKQVSNKQIYLNLAGL